MSCGCTEDHLCGEAKRLWRCKSFRKRQEYSDHRVRALGLGHREGLTIRARNMDGKKLRDL